MLSAARAWGATALTAAALMSTGAAPALAASGSGPASASASATRTSALYGRTDPTYDGVWRQSLSLMALRTQGVTPADSAVGWLLQQQCADGGWPSYNADPAKPCNATTEDTNASSVALQALASLGGHTDAVSKGANWFKTIQNKDGGWSYNPGGASDANSTALAVSALTAAGVDVKSVAKDGKTALSGLSAFQLGCTGTPAASRGAFAYQPDKSGKLAANDLASAQAALAAGQGRLPVSATAPVTAATGSATTCPDSATLAADYLSSRLASGGNHLTQSLAGASPTPDYNATAWAVLSLAHAGRNDAAAAAVNWLSQNAQPWIQGDHGMPNAGSLATLILAAQATGKDATAFGTTNLVAQLEATGPAPKSTPATTAAPSSAPASASATRAAAAAQSSSGSGFSPWWIVGVCLVAGIGIGLYLSYARGKRS
ncbi:prenyltransferase/squalene oxidase repeat-containing protein [Streptacidiphilus monticola]|uniref:Prenyltransferase/squalene oxidase repeat-containing protein n=1 Tax=Streptacidiphilus monticola TaxID=2161674 RepID=A0ABW1FWI1_9ACTN